MKIFWKRSVLLKVLAAAIVCLTILSCSLSNSEDFSKEGIKPDASDSIFGISTHWGSWTPISLGQWTDVVKRGAPSKVMDSILQSMVEAGITAIRSDYWWFYVEMNVPYTDADGTEVPAVEGKYHIPYFYKESINRAYEKGIKTNVCLLGHCSYYMPKNGGGVTDFKHEAFGDFAYNFAMEFAGKEVIYSIWNEPDLVWGWEPHRRRFRDPENGYPAGTVLDISNFKEWFPLPNLFTHKKSLVFIGVGDWTQVSGNKVDPAYAMEEGKDYEITMSEDGYPQSLILKTKVHPDETVHVIYQYDQGIVAKEYAHLFMEASRRIKEADPKAKVFGPVMWWINLYPLPNTKWQPDQGQLPYSAEWATGKSFLQIFLDELNAKGGVDKYLDGIEWHRYRHGPPETTLEGWASSRADEMKQLKKLVNSYPNKSGKKYEYWITELSWDAWDGKTTVSEETQAKYLAREYLINMMYGVDKVCWFVFENAPEYGGPGHDGYGIVKTHATDCKLEPKPAYYAYQLLAKLYGNSQDLTAPPFDIAISIPKSGMLWNCSPYGKVAKEVLIALWIQEEQKKDLAEITIDIKDIPAVGSPLVYNILEPDKPYVPKFDVKNSHLILSGIEVTDAPIIIKVPFSEDK